MIRLPEQSPATFEFGICLVAWLATGLLFGCSRTEPAFTCAKPTRQVLRNFDFDPLDTGLALFGGFTVGAAADTSLGERIASIRASVNGTLVTTDPVAPNGQRIGLGMWLSNGECSECYVHVFASTDLGATWEPAVEPAIDANARRDSPIYTEASFVLPDAAQGVLFRIEAQTDSTYNAHITAHRLVVIDPEHCGEGTDLCTLRGRRLVYETSFDPDDYTYALSGNFGNAAYPWGNAAAIGGGSGAITNTVPQTLTGRFAVATYNTVLASGRTSGTISMALSTDGGVTFVPSHSPAESLTAAGNSWREGAFDNVQSTDLAIVKLLAADIDGFSSPVAIDALRLYEVGSCLDAEAFGMGD